ncbi:hypothetical protein EDD92_0078 [Streptomyces sp. TLI_185]|nr:hypothetical protein EDD92_0078 [Streptomyces sp. TLI_185]
MTGASCGFPGFARRGSTDRFVPRFPASPRAFWHESGTVAGRAADLSI